MHDDIGVRQEAQIRRRIERIGAGQPLDGEVGDGVLSQCRKQVQDGAPRLARTHGGDLGAPQKLLALDTCAPERVRPERIQRGQRQRRADQLRCAGGALWRRKYLGAE